MARSDLLELRGYIHSFAKFGIRVESVRNRVRTLDRYFSAVSTRRNGVSSVKSKSHTKYENLWRDMLAYPSTWWDHRFGKESPKYPDFKKKQTGEALWLNDRRTPPWVASKLASLGPGTIPFHIFSCNKAKGYVKTLELFHQMQREGIIEDSYTYVHALKACTALGDLGEGRRIHRQISDKGCKSDLYMTSALVDMYAKCGSLEEARSVFDAMSTRDTVSWNAIIQGYVKCEQGLEALELFQRMQREGVEPSSVTFLALLNAAAGLCALEDGRRLHQQIIVRGLQTDEFVSNCLIDMYAKCGSLEDARNVFKNVPTNSVVSWNVMMLGCVKCGQGQEALELFQDMQRHGAKPNSATFIALCNACASESALEEGRRLHNHIILSGCESDIYVCNSLIDMYVKCGSLEDARSVFNKMPTKTLVSWNAILLGCVRCGQGLEAFELFKNMQLAGIEPNSSTFVAMLNACARTGHLEEGKSLHTQTIKRNCELDAYVGNSLVNMYAKCGSLEDAQRVFKRMPTRDVVSLNCMILGFVQWGQGLQALDLFEQMQQEGAEPDSTTFVGLLNACASIAALEEGRRIHKLIIHSGCVSDACIGNALVDMYAKCGSIQDAEIVFHNMPNRDVVSWTALIMGYALHGLAKKAIELFEHMVLEGVEMSELVFVCLLSACSHGGLVKEGIQYFDAMRSVYGIPPGLEHFTSMVDLLGRAGRLDDAEDMIKTMHLEPSVAVWMSLLSACRIHGNVEMGERAAKQVLKLDPENAAGHVLLLNIYASGGHFKSQQQADKLMPEKKGWKLPGRTWIEVDNKVHTFVVHDKHPRTSPFIRENWQTKLAEKIKNSGDVPDTKIALLNDQEEKKIKQLCCHSEKLAIAF